MNILKSFTYNTVAPKIAAVADELNLKQPDMVLISGSDGKVAASEVSVTELGHLNSVNNEIQGQLDNGDILMNNTSNELLTSIDNVSFDISSNIFTTSNNIIKYFNTDNIPNGTTSKYIENSFYYNDLNVIGNLTVQNFNIEGESQDYISTSITNVSEVVSDSLNNPVLKIIGKSDENIIEMSHGTDNKVIMTSVGNIGIGTTIPIVEIDIVGSIKSSGTINEIRQEQFDYLLNVTDNIQTQIDNLSSINENIAISSNISHFITNMSNNVMSDISDTEQNIDYYIEKVTYEKQDRINFSSVFIEDPNDNSLSLKNDKWDTNADNISFTANGEDVVNVYSDKITINTIDAAISSDINSKQDVITGAATTVLNSNLNVNKMLISDADGKINTHDVSIDEMQFLSDVTGSVQDQIDNIKSTITNTSNVLTNINNTEYSKISEYANTVAADTIVEINGKQTTIENFSDPSLIQIDNTITYSFSSNELKNIVESQSVWKKDTPEDEYISYNNVRVYADNIEIKNVTIFEQPSIVFNGDVQNSSNFVDIGNNQYVYSFTHSNSNINSVSFPQDTRVDVLIVGGGGAGGHGFEGVGGGGGGGSVYIGSNIMLSANVEYTIVVGKGGSSAFGEKGGDSSAFGIKALGGGVGGNSSEINGISGASGGGGGINLYTSNVGIGANGINSLSNGGDGSILIYSLDGEIIKFPRENLSSETFTYSDGIVTRCKASTVYDNLDIHSSFKLFDGVILANDAVIYSTEKMYPPVRNFSSNSHTVSGQLYGNGLYEVSASTIHNAGPAYTGFNEANTTGFHAATGKYSSSTGIYTANTHYIVNDYKGDWLKLKLPDGIAIKMTKYKFKTRGTDINRPPGKYKIYGSNDNTNWTELVHKTTTVTYSDTGDGTYYYEESITTLGTYNYFALVVNQIAGTGTDVLNFDEWYIYGKETSGGGGGGGGAGDGGDTDDGDGGDGQIISIIQPAFYCAGGGSGGGSPGLGSKNYGGGGDGWDTGNNGASNGKDGVVIIAIRQQQIKKEHIVVNKDSLLLRNLSSNIMVNGANPYPMSYYTTKTGLVYEFQPGLNSIRFPTDTVCDVLLVGGGGGTDNLELGQKGNPGNLIYSTGVTIPTGDYELIVGDGGTLGTDGENTTAFGATAMGGRGMNLGTRLQNSSNIILEDSLLKPDADYSISDVLLNNNLRVWYKFSGYNGSDDSSSHFHNATVTGSPAVVDNIIKITKDDYLKLPSNVIDFDSDITISFWYRFDNDAQDYGRLLYFSKELYSVNTNDSIIISRDEKNENLWFIIDLCYIKIDFGHTTNDDLIHLTWVIQKNGRWIIYKNGVQIYNKIEIYPPTNTYYYSYLGKSNYSSSQFHFDNQISLKDFRIYNKYLSSYDINIIYNEYSTTSIVAKTHEFNRDPNMYAWYKFDGDFQDSSGNYRHGTGHENPAFVSDSKKQGSHSLALIGGGGADIGQHVSIPSANISLWDGFTMSFWVYFGDNTNETRIVEYGVNNYLMNMHVINVDNVLALVFSMNNGVTISYKKYNDIVEKHIWKHFAITINKLPQVSWKLYVNSSLVNAADESGDEIWFPDISSSKFRIGKDVNDVFIQPSITGTGTIQSIPYEEETYCAIFTGDGSITFEQDTECEVLVVGGGGGGGLSLAGGGGGGGVAYIEEYVFEKNKTFDITVGKGGVGLTSVEDSTNNNGEESIISSGGIEYFKGIGGGGSVGQSNAYHYGGKPRSGGSGAGGVRHSNEGATSTQSSANLIPGTLLYGNNGGNGTNSANTYGGGGGGGAGERGGDATGSVVGKGGDGIMIPITGQDIYYGGGGGGDGHIAYQML